MPKSLTAKRPHRLAHAFPELEKIGESPMPVRLTFDLSLHNILLRILITTPDDVTGLMQFCVTRLGSGVMNWLYFERLAHSAVTCTMAPVSRARSASPVISGGVV